MKYYLYISKINDVYTNQAIEKTLFEECRKDGMTVYLWANHHAVVIGRNQNAYSELNVKLFEEEGGSIARRISGGGAVYHDINNLNFTFIAPNNGIYNNNAQFNIIVRAVNSLGLKAELSGRNDIEIGGKKFSGNAFYNSDGCSLHHGTILIDTDISKLERYLTVDKSKIVSKGVSSVSSRVVNISQLIPGITREEMERSIVAALYDGEVAEIPIDNSTEKTKRTRRVFCDRAWIFGKNPKYDIKNTARFTWGTAEVRFGVDKEIITELTVFTDSLEYGLFEGLPALFKGVSTDSLSLDRVAVRVSGERERIIVEDIISLIKDSFR